jgi:hypothetical protein
LQKMFKYGNYYDLKLMLLFAIYDIGLKERRGRLSNQVKLYLSQAPNTTGYNLTVKCLLTNP